ncbi:hypothetical protein [Flavobacterium sp. 3HN19-14]|uniref:hypothetical protein n=1 Tax=Flavobacterium sp. 3HN19-14 TaxID=3448133 RepID=UPI003EE36D9A
MHNVSGTYHYPTEDVVSNNSGFAQQISGCNYTDNDYSTLTGLLVGEDYIFTCKLGDVDNYITVTDANNEVIASGPSPLTVEDISASAVNLHYSDDETCAGQTGCHVTTMQIVLTCPVPLNGQVSGVTTTSADFAWEPGGSETAWEVLLLPAADPAPTQETSGIAVNSNPNYTASALDPATSYSLYVRARLRF